MIRESSQRSLTRVSIRAPLSKSASRAMAVGTIREASSSLARPTRDGLASNSLREASNAPISAVLIAASRDKRYVSNEARKPLFDKILIANRGEIACRVMRTAKRLGVKTVAVYSEPDRNAMHVKMADEAYLLGPAASSESYLRMDKIIEVAKATGAQAIHPGYGFLSENAKFAEMLAGCGLVFIGPPTSAIRSMGSKSESKDIMLAAGVPCTPGYHGSNQDPDFLKERAEEIGYPVLIKATKGGGGKGMKLVETPAAFLEGLESAKRESAKSFGDDTVLIEKYIPISRHVEVQIFADTHGDCVYVFERDCSVQRRHQKIIEEAPAPGLSEDLRRKLGETAVAAAKAVNYVGAGTVEFLMDVRDHSFYFMEMNTRLQVEHPVSEMISGTDLVEWQLEAAAGNHLPMSQSELKRNGHAFEARIYAEKPRNNFLPDTGKLVHVRTPEPSPSVRLETGFEEGDEISVHYDPMIAKLVVHGRDRREALRILRKALASYEVVGPSTNIAFLQAIASHPAFARGDVHTAFIPQHSEELFPPEPEPSPEALAHAGLFMNDQSRPIQSDQNPFSTLSSARFGFGDDVPVRSFSFAGGEQVEIRPDIFGRGSSVTVRTKGKETSFPIATLQNAEDGSQSAMLGNRRSKATVCLEGECVHVFDGRPEGDLKVKLAQPEWLVEILGKKEGAVGSAKAPMPCKVTKVLVSEGQTVEAGQALVALEAMKTELLLRAPKASVVLKLNCKEGDQVSEGKDLVEFVAEEELSTVLDESPAQAARASMSA